MSYDSIDIQYLNSYNDISKLLKEQPLNSIWEDLSLEIPVSFIFMSDNELLEINRDVLNHDYYTDVITFNYDDEDIEYNEILISADRIREHSTQFNQTLKQETYRICIHGMLHLAGYDDQTPEEKKQMTTLENHYLKLYCST